MQEELNAVLQKNLPAQVAGEMKKALEDYEKVKKELEATCKKIRKMEDDLNVLTAENIRLSKLEQKYKEGIKTNRANADALSESQRDLKVRELQYKLDSEQKIVSSQHELMSIAFKHVRPVTVTHQNEITNMGNKYDGYGNQIYDNNNNPEMVETGKTVDSRTEVIDE